jgi:hypothetical protein
VGHLVPACFDPYDGTLSTIDFNSTISFESEVCQCQDYSLWIPDALRACTMAAFPIRPKAFDYQSLKLKDVLTPLSILDEMSGQQ